MKTLPEALTYFVKQLQNYNVEKFVLCFQLKKDWRGSDARHCFNGGQGKMNSAEVIELLRKTADELELGQANKDSN